MADEWENHTMRDGTRYYTFGRSSYRAEDPRDPRNLKGTFHTHPGSLEMAPAVGEIVAMVGVMSRVERWRIPDDRLAELSIAGAVAEVVNFDTLREIGLFARNVDLLYEPYRRR